MSIQLTLSGHSFSEEKLNEQLASLFPTAKAAAAEMARSGGTCSGDADPTPGPMPTGTDATTDGLPATVQLAADVEVLTDKTVLVPRELFDETGAAAWLRMAGMACPAGEMPVWSATDNDTIALMALPRKAAELLHHYFGTDVHYDSPLRTLTPQTVPTGKVVRIHDTNPLIYIKVYDDRQALQFAEVIACETAEEFAYLLHRLDAAFALKEFTAELSGIRAKAWKRESKHYFAKIQCA